MIVLMHVVLLLVVLLILLRRECCGTSPHQLCTVRVVMSLVVHALCTCMVMVRGDLLLCLGLEGKFVLPLSAKLFEVFFLHSFAREDRVEGVDDILDHTFLEALGLLLRGDLRSC